jgi:ABC-2 type transport system permease protein
MYLLGVGTMFFLWNKLIKDNITIGSYNLSSIMAYYLLSGLFISNFNARTTKHFEKLIQHGELNAILIKPLSTSLYLFFREIGVRFGVNIFTFLIFFSLVVIIPGIRTNIEITLYTMSWSLIFFILSNVFLYLFFWTLGTLAFWVITTSGLRNISMNLINILKGQWFPLDIAPAFFQRIMALLPFQYSMFYQIQILTGKSDPSTNVQGVAILILSILLLSILAALLWSRGLRKYESVGG